MVVVPEFPVCSDVTMEVVPVLICQNVIKEIIPKISVCPDKTKKVVPEFPVCPNVAMIYCSPCSYAVVRMTVTSLLSTAQVAYGISCSPVSRPRRLI